MKPCRFFFTPSCQGPLARSKKVKMKTVSEMTDRNHFDYTMYTVGADAKENLLMAIHYERIKK